MNHLFINLLWQIKTTVIALKENDFYNGYIHPLGVLRKSLLSGIRAAYRWSGETWPGNLFPTERVRAYSKINIQYSQGCLSIFKARLFDTVSLYEHLSKVD